MKLARLFALLLVLLVPVASGGQALRYVVFPAPPFMIGADSDADELTGIDVTIVRELARRLKLTLVVVKAPWARALNLMETGKADLLSSAFRTPEREVFMDYFAEPFLTSLPIAFYTWKGSGVHLDTFEDLARVKSIGVLRGASYFEKFDKATNLAKVEVSSQDQLMPMVASRRLEVMAGYVDTENYRLVNEGFGDKLERLPLVYDNPVAVYMALSRLSPLRSRLAEFNAVNHQLLAEGFVAKAVAQYRRSVP